MHYNKKQISDLVDMAMECGKENAQAEIDSLKSALAAAPRWVPIEECPEPASQYLRGKMIGNELVCGGPYAPIYGGKWNEMRENHMRLGYTHIFLIPPPPEESHD